MNHLTDLELDDLLLGEASAAHQAHLDACPDCAARFAAVAEPIASFREVTLAWSERRSATLPAPDARRATSATLPWARRAGWLAATAAALAVAVLLPAHRNQPQQQANMQRDAQPAPVPVAQPAPIQTATVQPPAPSANELRRQQQIAADNQMLAAIDHELDASQAQLAAYGVTVSESSPTQEGSPARRPTSPRQD